MTRELISGIIIIIKCTCVLKYHHKTTDTCEGDKSRIKTFEMFNNNNNNHNI